MDVGVVFTLSCAGKPWRNWKRPKTVAYLAFPFPTIKNFFINTRFAERRHYGRFSLQAGEVSAQNSDSPSFETFYGAVRAGSRSFRRHGNVTCTSVGGGDPESGIVALFGLRNIKRLRRKKVDSARVFYMGFHR